MNAFSSRVLKSVMQTCCLFVLVSSVAAADKAGVVLYEKWDNQRGMSLDYADFSLTPDSSDYRTAFSGPRNAGSIFSARLTAQVTVPESGSYEFYVSSDNQSALKLSLNGNYDGLTEVAYLQRSVDRRVWDLYPSQKSSPFSLEAGTQILIQALHKEMRDDDHILIGWSLNGGAIEVIDGTHCSVPEIFGLTTPSLAVDMVTADKIALTWNANYEGVGVKEYKIYRRIEGDGEAKVIATSRNTVFNDVLPPGTIAHYSISSVNTDGVQSPVSSEVQVVVPAGTISYSNGTGLAACYYGDKLLENPVHTCTDATVNFSWPKGTPAAPGTPTQFSARWVGYVQPRFTEEVTFHLLANDGVRLWVDGNLLVNSWGNGDMDVSGSLALEAGNKYEIELQYYNQGGNGAATLSWSGPSFTRKTIPQSQLFPNSYANGGTGVALSTLDSSITSPAFVEGQVGADAETITLNGAAVTRLSRYTYYADVALDAVAATDITIATETDSISQSITWTPTDIANGGFVTIRKGDSLLLTASGTGTSLEIDDNLDSDAGFQADFVGVVGENYVKKFDAAGTQIVQAQIDGVLVDTLTVTVADVDFQGPTACEINFMRTKEIRALGVLADELTVIGADYTTLGMTTTSKSGDLITTSLVPVKVGTPKMIVRLGQDGPILATQEVEEFTFDLRSRQAMCVHDFEGITAIIGVITMEPKLDYLDLEIEIKTSDLTFPDSTIIRNQQLSEYEWLDWSPYPEDEDNEDGYLHYLLVPVDTIGENTKTCHSLIVFQDGIAVSKQY